MLPLKLESYIYSQGDIRTSVTAAQQFEHVSCTAKGKQVAKTVLDITAVPCEL